MKIHLKNSTKLMTDSDKVRQYLAKTPSGVGAVKLILIFVFGFFLGLTTYKFLKGEKENSAKNGNASQRQSGKFKFINPLLECEYLSNIEDKNINSIEIKTRKTIEEYIKSGEASNVSLYYRDLNNGPWFGINEDENYKPASLLKVPVFIAYLKKIDNNMNLLSSTVGFKEGELEMPEPAEGLDPLKPGEKYSLEILFQRMVVNSDNQAYTLLINRIDSQELDSVLSDLGMTVPDVSKGENIVTAKSYASLFRVLYNSSYLSRNASEYALNLMSYARYDKGITKNLPDEITVSHKFGLRKDIDPTGQIYLHDCGIVYYPEKPYLLCVMTRGEDYDKLSEIISNLSKDVYDEIKLQ